MKRQKYQIKQRCFNLKCAKMQGNIIKKQKFTMRIMSKDKGKGDKNKSSSYYDKKFSKKQIFLLLISGGVIGFLNGFFGGGGGMVCVPMLSKVLKLDAKRSHASAIAVIFPLSLISAFIYVINGYISSLPLLTVGLGVIAGGLIGAYALKILPPRAVRLIFAIIMFVGGIKLII